ncbi:MAG: bifunctional nuclease family protein [Planctomycetota bacterium]|jgi:hypothetical protein|nr:bifunctional nuclease family protein [Planctomycetota bacterium]
MTDPGDSKLDSLETVEVKRIAGPIDGTGAALFLGNETKTFVIFVGLFEASAIVKEMHEQKSARPMTHDLMGSVLLGFDIEVKRVIISDIIDNTFCATLILEQGVDGEDSEWIGKRNEVRIDSRASDSIIIALKSKCPIQVSQEVFDQVDDISTKIDIETGASPDQAHELDLGEVDFDLRLDEDETDEQDD